MVNLIILSAIGLISIATHFDDSYDSSIGAYFLTEHAVQKECRVYSDQEIFELSQKNFGKKSSYVQNSYTYCKTPIFEYGERQNSINFLTAHARSQVQSSLKKAILLAKENGKSESSWMVQVSHPNPKLKHYLYSLIQSELWMMNISILRSKNSKGYKGNLLVFKANPSTYEQDLLNPVMYREPLSGGGPKWHAL